MAGGVKTVDPTYVDDFWSTGLRGADPSSPVNGDRIQFDTTVVAVGDNTVTLAEAPPGNPIGIDLEVTSGASAGQSADFVTIDGQEVRVGGGLASTVEPGDSVRLDNSWVLALQYYHRYQVPPAESFG